MAFNIMFHPGGSGCIVGVGTDWVNRGGWMICHFSIVPSSFFLSIEFHVNFQHIDGQ